MHARTPTRTSRRHDGQAGFGMIELLVVMVIIAILMAVAVPMFLSARKTSRQKSASQAAAMYATAIESFKMQHAGALPQLGNANQWANAQQGPVDVTRRPYMKSVPDVVRNGAVGFNATGQWGQLGYQTFPNGSYVVTVTMNWGYQCAQGTGTTTTGPLRSCAG